MQILDDPYSPEQDSEERREKLKAWWDSVIEKRQSSEASKAHHVAAGQKSAAIKALRKAKTPEERDVAYARYKVACEALLTAQRVQGLKGRDTIKREGPTRATKAQKEITKLTNEVEHLERGKVLLTEALRLINSESDLDDWSCDVVDFLSETDMRPIGDNFN